MSPRYQGYAGDSFAHPGVTVATDSPLALWMVNQILRWFTEPEEAA